VGMVLRMPCNSSTNKAVCSSTELIDFGIAFCNPRLLAPSVRVSDLMKSSVLFKGFVMVWMALGVGGANPPVIPIIV
jgi:hypothetical protein